MVVLEEEEEEAVVQVKGEKDGVSHPAEVESQVDHMLRNYNFERSSSCHSNYKRTDDLIETTPAHPAKCLLLFLLVLLVLCLVASPVKKWGPSATVANAVVAVAEGLLSLKRRRSVDGNTSERMKMEVGVGVKKEASVPVVQAVRPLAG